MGYAESNGDIPAYVKFKMAAWQPFLLRNHDVLGYNSQSIDDMVFVHAQEVGFGGMPSSMAIFPLMLNSKWPPGSHFYCAIMTF